MLEVTSPHEEIPGPHAEMRGPDVEMRDSDVELRCAMEDHICDDVKSVNPGPDVVSRRHERGGGMSERRHVGRGVTGRTHFRVEAGFSSLEDS